MEVRLLWLLLNGEPARADALRGFDLEGVPFH
jgi:hypothetical protein